MLSEPELVALVQRLMDGVEDEGKAKQVLSQLRAHLPHPALADLIYWPERVDGFPHPEPTADEIVQFAAAYLPRPLEDGELAELFDAVIRRPGPPELVGEEAYRIADTFPEECDWDLAVEWARLQGWSGAELVGRIHSGELERDPEYQEWLTTYQGDYE